MYSCPLGDLPRVGSCLCASRLGATVWGTALSRALARSEEQERQHYANQVGTDGWALLAALEAPRTPDWMRSAACHYDPAYDLGAAV